MADKTIRLIVGALIAGALLGLYAWVLIDAIQYARGIGGAPTEGAFWILHSIGGLVSALVAAQLAVTPGPGDPGTAGLFVFGGAPADKAATIIALVYLVIWLALGFGAVIFGLVQPKQAVPQLADFAKAWIGLALAAAYAYFGIKQPAA